VNLADEARREATQLRYDVGQHKQAGTNWHYARAAELLERLADAVEVERVGPPAAR
jgi:hypothetical protein